MKPAEKVHSAKPSACMQKRELASAKGGYNKRALREGCKGRGRQRHIMENDTRRVGRRRERHRGTVRKREV